MTHPYWALVGATGVGKTELSLDLARVVSLEVVGLDSRQIYIGMDIGTSKPTPAEQSAVQHHLIDVITPDIRWDAMAYARAARRAISEISDRGVRPLVVGGSGFYLAALSGQLSEELPARDEAVRAALQAEAEERGTPMLWERLRDRDPETAGRIHPNDTYRVVRALEIMTLTGRSPTLHAVQNPPVAWGAWRVVVVTRSRDELKATIRHRVLHMIRAGWADEVRELLRRGYDRASPGMSSLGYPEMIDHVEGMLSLDGAVERITTRTWQYAKRQLTWFRRFPAECWVTLENTVHAASHVMNLFTRDA